MIQSRNSLSEKLDYYDDYIKDLILELKDSHLDQITVNCDSKEKSKRFYDESINLVSSGTQIEGIIDIRPYYPKGLLLYDINKRPKQRIIVNVTRKLRNSDR